MISKEISREEFDMRLEQSTRNMRENRLILEARAVELEDLIAQYTPVLEKLEATRNSSMPSLRKHD